MVVSCAMQQSDVAWEYDVDHLYGPVQPVNFNTEQLAASRGGNTSGTVLNKNEHFIVWMRPAAQPTFRKLWAVIDTPLPAGGQTWQEPKRPLCLPIGAPVSQRSICCTHSIESERPMAWCWPDVLGGLTATDTGDDQHSFSTTPLAQPPLTFHLAWCDI